MKEISKQDLLDLKRRIEEKKIERAEMVGRKKSLMKELKDKWNCERLDDVEKKAENHRKKADRLEAKIKERIEELENKFPDI